MTIFRGINFKLNKASGELHPIPAKAELWNKVGMDLIRPLVEATQGNKHRTAITEYFMKWDEAGAFPNKTAVGVAKFLYSTVS